MIITSTANEQIKLIRKLKDRKYRMESGLFFLEGIRHVIEAIDSSYVITQIIVSWELLTNSTAIAAVKKAESAGQKVLEVSRDVFETLSEKEGPQGLAAVACQKWTPLEELGDHLQGFWIALYQVADPGNLGTILRSLDGMGGKGVFLIDHCTDPFDPSAIRASMGAIFSKTIIGVTSAELIDWIKKNRIQLIGTSDAAKKNYHRYSYPKDMILLMGSEREGLPENWKTITHDMVSIPMAGKADSLNLAVASSIILYEMASQHEKDELKV